MPMAPARGTATPQLDPGRFRCLVCRAYVTGTPSGHCPTCGFVPPVAPQLSPPRPVVPWYRHVRPRTWVIVCVLLAQLAVWLR